MDLLSRAEALGLLERPPRSAAHPAALGVSLPRPLAAWHQAFDRTSALHRVHFQVLGPEALLVEQDHLVFALEPQEVCRWGVSVHALTEPDPPVFQQPAGDAWYAQEQTLGAFLEMVLLAHFCWGAAPVRGQRDEPPSTSALAEAGWAQVTNHDGLILHQLDGAAITCLEGLGCTGGARDANSFRQHLEPLGFER